MSATMTTPKCVSLPIAGQKSGCGVLQAERQRLMAEAGLTVGPIAHFKRPVERLFTRQERDHTTILFGGLTMRHEKLILAGLEGLGYKVGLVPTPKNADFQAGKEYG